MSANIVLFLIFLASCHCDDIIIKTFYNKPHSHTCHKNHFDCTPEDILKLTKFDPAKHRCCVKYTCKEGYVISKKNETVVCEPICSPPCVDGPCIAPNQCLTCKSPLVIQGSECIERPCMPSCGTHALCENGTCNCLPNYEPLNATHCELRCKKGYERNKSTSQCQPLCDRCEYGKCAEPNVCQCFDGYEKRSDICAPVCSSNENCHCRAPDECDCYPGYERKNNEICEPICKNKCIHGSCEKPDICTCLPGYKPTHNNYTCEPVCQDCDNGECVDVNNCECHRGYSKRNNKCTPVCNPPCENGFCVEPNQCACNNKYKLRNGSAFICDPVCSACDDGVCVEPDVCKCEDNFEAVNGSCKQMQCTTCGGQCTTTEDCSCPDGRPCLHEVMAETAVMLAGVPPIPWIVGGMIIIVLFAISTIVLFRLYIKRKSIEETNETQVQGSVMYTLPEARLTCAVDAQAAQVAEAGSEKDIRHVQQQLLVYHDQNSDEIV